MLRWFYLGFPLPSPSASFFLDAQVVLFARVAFLSLWSLDGSCGRPFRSGLARHLFFSRWFGASFRVSVFVGASLVRPLPLLAVRGSPEVCISSLIAPTASWQIPNWSQRLPYLLALICVLPGGFRSVSVYRPWVAWRANRRPLFLCRRSSLGPPSAFSDTSGQLVIFCSCPPLLLLWQ